MPSSECIVVGSGMAGLVAAARLTAHGHHVTVLEQREQAGGYFGGFRNDAGDHFDLAVSHLLGGHPGGALHTLLHELDLEHAVHLEPVDVADVMVIGDRRVTLPTGLDRLQTSLGVQFPESTGDLAAFFGFMRQFLGDDDGSQDKGRFMMRNYRRGFEEFCTATVADPLLRTALAMRIQCDESSLMIMAGFFTECYAKGMVSLRGGMRTLVDALVGSITESGGEVLLGAEVTAILAADGIAHGVRLADGSTRAGDVVLYNGDVFALETMLAEHGGAGIAVEGRRRGHSSLSLFLTLEGADLSRFAGAARHYLTDTDDVFETYRVLETGRLPHHPVIKLHFPSRIDPSLAAPGRDLLRVEVDMYHDEEAHDEAFYDEYAQVIEALVARRLVPELREHCVYRRVVTPLDYLRWFGHRGGSATGWAHDVDNYLVRRISQRTGLQNTFITGQWGEHGSGLPQLIASAARSISLAENWLRKRAQQ